MKKATKLAKIAKKAIKSAILGQKPTKITKTFKLSIPSRDLVPQLLNGTIYYNSLTEEYQLIGIRGQEDLLLKLDKYANTKNNLFLLFMAEFGGMVRTEEEKRRKLSWKTNHSFAGASTLATTVSTVNWAKHPRAK